MLYKLYSAVDRCMPCKMLVRDLDKNFPDWKSYIRYIDADTMDSQDAKLLIDLKVFSVPTVTDDSKVLFKGYNPNMVQKIKELCLTQE